MSRKRAYRNEPVGKDGWLPWEAVPVDTKFFIACCDCGLVHEYEFRSGKVTHTRTENGRTYVTIQHSDPSKTRVMIRCRRNERCTAALRRENRKRESASGNKT